MIMDNVMTAISQAYSLNSRVAIIMKLLSVKLETMTVAMPNTTAAPQIMMHERLGKNFL